MNDIFDKIAESRKTGEIEFSIKECKADSVISIMPGPCCGSRMEPRII